MRASECSLWGKSWFEDFLVLKCQMWGCGKHQFNCPPLTSWLNLNKWPVSSNYKCLSAVCCLSPLTELMQVDAPPQVLPAVHEPGFCAHSLPLIPSNPLTTVYCSGTLGALHCVSPRLDVLHCTENHLSYLEYRKSARAAAFFFTEYWNIVHSLLCFMLWGVQASGC